MRRLTFAMLAVAALVALPIGSGIAAKPAKPSLSLKSQTNPVVFFRTAVMSGKLTGSNHANRSVAIQKDRFPYDHFVPAGTTTTNTGGSYSFRAHPPRNTRYRVKVGNTTSNVVTELVRIRVSLRLSDSTPKVGQRVRFFGRACPQHDGALVKIQRFSRTLRRWVTKRRTVLRDIPGSTCSRYSRRLRVLHDGTFRTVVIPNDKDHVRGISRKRFINAHS